MASLNRAELKELFGMQAWMYARMRMGVRAGDRAEFIRLLKRSAVLVEQVIGQQGLVPAEAWEEGTLK